MHAKRPAVSSSKSVDTIEDTSDNPDKVEVRLSFTLVLFNAFLSLVHYCIAIYVAFNVFKFPLSFFYTTYKDSILNDFTCLFDYGFNVSGLTSYCENPLDTTTGTYVPPLSCIPALNRSDTTPALSNTGGPLLSAFEITRFGQGNDTAAYIDDLGKKLSKWILFTIEATTAFSHSLYFLFFWRVYTDLKACRSQGIVKYFDTSGGVPLRWTEYALTSALMVIYIANISNLFEFFGILALVLATFSLMYFGQAIELLLVEKKLGDALILLYIPGMAIFLSIFAPVLQSLATTVHKISCNSYETDTFLNCRDKTCFGKEVPIALFCLVLLYLFASFPLVLINKVYIVSGWSGYVGRLNRISNKWAKGVTQVILQSIGSILFVFFGFMLACLSLLQHILSPVLPSKYLFYKVFPEHTQSRKTLLWCEIAYAGLSATSKIFLALFFLINFASRTW